MKKNQTNGCVIHAGRKILLMMKLTLLILLGTFMSVSASVWGQQMTIRFENARLQDVFKEIRQQTGYTFVFNESAVNKAGKVSVKINSEDVKQVLDKCLAGTSLGYTIEGDLVIILSKEEKAALAAQSVKISGKIVDMSGNPLPGVTVMIKGTTLGCATDTDGKFTLEIPDGQTVSLECTFVGMKKKTVEVKNIREGMAPLTIKMEEESVNVDEVVVVGYGTTKIHDLTGQVSSVTEAQIEKRNATNVETLLQNAAAGVVVSRVSANPADKIRVRVRGEASFSGDNEPLYVVDGIPVDANTMNALSPNDIQSMDVLKDASAAAIYGSRGANGVVIVTTKRGKKGDKPDLNISYNFSTDTKIDNYSMLNGDQFREFVRYAAQNTLEVDPSNTYATEILKEGSTSLMDANTDWYEELSRVSQRHDIDLSVRGGSERTNYYISLGILDYTGVMKNDDYTRYTGRINLDFDITDFLKFGTSTTLGYTDIYSAGTSMFTAIGFRPDFPVYNEDGTYFKNGTTTNPVANNEQEIHSDNYNILSTNYLELKIYKGLKFKTSLALKQSMSYNRNFSPSFLSSDKKATGGESTSRSFGTVFDNTLSYSGKFKDIHSIDAVAGLSFERTMNRGFGLDVKNYPMDEILTGLTNATEFVRKSGSAVVYGLQSSFARLNYRLMDRYLFTFTARYDGSSSFGSNNRYGFFPSGAIAWRISQESFLKDVKVINDLKIKASAGRTGVQNFDPTAYANKDLYVTGSYLDNPAIIHDQMANRDIKWETTVQYDLGIDFTLLDYRLSGSVGYYRKNTEGLIDTYIPPLSLAVKKVPTNIGSVRNQGVEFTIKASILRDNEWKWNVTLNAAHNRNKVLKLVKDGALDNGMGIVMQGTGSQVLAEGYAMGSFLGYEYDGIIQDQATVDRLNEKAKAAGKTTYDGTLRPGHLQIRDVDGSGYIDNKDRVIIGSPEPDLTGGLVSDLSWKGFNLYTHFGFLFGGLKQYNKTLQNLPGQLTGLLDYNLYNRWTVNNTSASLPAMYIGDGVSRLTTLELHKASYFRLQELRLSYELPAIWKRKYLKSGEVYFAATNLFTITEYPGIDPTTIGSANAKYGANYDSFVNPGMRTFSVGMKLNF